VNYLHYIGGFNLKEAVNLCLKEALKDSLTPSFTWWGREGEPRPLYNARIIVAIYGTSVFLFLHVNINIIITFLFLSINCVFLRFFAKAVCKNRHFQKPTRTEFQTQAKEALRAAKERARSKLLGPRARVPNPIAIFGMTRQSENKNKQIMNNYGN